MDGRDEDRAGNEPGEGLGNGGVRLLEASEFPKPFDWRNAQSLTMEQREILAIFTEMLRYPTADGGKKRAAGEKPDWRSDYSHEDAAWRHLHRKLDGDLYDEDSGAHAYIHAAWRLLAVAYQEGALRPNERGEE